MADKQQEIPKIRTFKTDTEIYVKEKKISGLDITSSAYKAGIATTKPALYAEHPRKRIIIYASLALAVILILGSGGYFAYKFYFNVPPGVEEELNVPGISKPPKPFLVVDGEKTIQISITNPGRLTEVLQTERKKALRPGTLIYFPLLLSVRQEEEKYLDAQDFIKIISWRPPKTLSGNLLPEFNTLISYNLNSKDLVLIFKVKDFNSSFASMLKWEATMWQDWKSFMGSQDFGQVASSVFEDTLIKNNDARVLKNTAREIILGYSIFNKEFVIVSTSRESLSEVIGRFIAIPPR